MHQMNRMKENSFFCRGFLKKGNIPKKKWFWHEVAQGDMAQGFGMDTGCMSTTVCAWDS